MAYDAAPRRLWQFSWLPPAFFLQSCSTSSKLNPFVSGTYTATKMKASTAIPAMIRNVMPVPTNPTIDRNVWATTRLEIQLTVADMPPHIPQYTYG
jgi:hypothetical protein